MTDSTTSRPPLFTYPFITLSLTTLIGFANIAVFYGFYPYLLRIGISPFWAALLLPLESMTSFLLRPVISPRLHAGNALTVMRWSMVAVGAALLCYPLATTPALLLPLRAIHGAAFVSLVSATTALLVHFIPPSRSAEGFGIFTLASLLPFALVPPVAEALLGVLPSMAQIYAWMAVLSIPALLLMFGLGKAAREVAARAPTGPVSGRAEIASALRTPGVPRVLGVGLCVFFSSSLLFFFIKDHALDLGMANAGLYFTVSTGSTIAVRLGGSALFDRLPRIPALVLSLLLLAGCYAAYALLPAPTPFLVAAAGFGAATGLAMPLLQSQLFHLATPERRGLTANLMLSTMDAGLFLGPYAGGLLLGAGLSFAGLSFCSAGLALAGAALISRSRDPRNAPSGH